MEWGTDILRDHLQCFSLNILAEELAVQAGSSVDETSNSVRGVGKVSSNREHMSFDLGKD